MSSKAQDYWLQLVLDGTDPKSATKEAFECNTPDGLRSKTGQLKKLFATELHNAVMDNIKFLSPAILITIRDIALDKNSEGIPHAVRLKACSELLSRAGYDPSIDINVTEDLTKEEIQGRIDSLLNENPTLIEDLKTSTLKPH